MTARLCPTDYQQVLSLIQKHAGLRVHHSRMDEVVYVINDLLASMPFANVFDLLLALDTSPFTDTLWQIFIQTITVGETYFFRDQGQIEALRNHILPQLIAERRKSGRKELRVWSAGCASGEEPYSIVMLLHELLPDLANWQITVLGTDINLTFLERARRGLYRAASFRNETPDYVQKYWFRAAPDGYQLDPAIRDKVTFLPLNLVTNPDAAADTITLNMDLILCRNVTIYFEPETVRAIVARFHQALNDGGTLIVGHSELSTTLYSDFSTQTCDRIVYYQKSGVSPRASDGLLATPPRAARSAIVRPRLALPPALPPALLPAQLPARSSAPVSAAAENAQADALEAVWSRAKEAADREKWDEALAVLTQVEHVSMFRPEFHYLRGLVQMAAENADKALWAWRQALYCDPMFALAHYSLGELYEQRGERKLAARCWRQAMAAIAKLEPTQRLLFSEDLTVEMLQGLLAYRVRELAGSDKEVR